MSRMNIPAEREGTCAGCGHRFKLRLDGMVRRHRVLDVSARDPAFRRRCAGAEREPVSGSVEAVNDRAL